MAVRPNPISMIRRSFLDSSVGAKNPEESLIENFVPSDEIAFDERDEKQKNQKKFSNSFRFDFRHFFHRKTREDLKILESRLKNLENKLDSLVDRGESKRKTFLESETSFEKEKPVKQVERRKPSKPTRNETVSEKSSGESSIAEDLPISHRSSRFERRKTNFEEKKPFASIFQLDDQHNSTENSRRNEWNSDRNVRFCEFFSSRTNSILFSFSGTKDDEYLTASFEQPSGWIRQEFSSSNRNFSFRKSNDRHQWAETTRSKSGKKIQRESKENRRNQQTKRKKSVETTRRTTETKTQSESRLFIFRIEKPIRFQEEEEKLRKLENQTRENIQKAPQRPTKKEESISEISFESSESTDDTVTTGKNNLDATIPEDLPNTSLTSQSKSLLEVSRKGSEKPIVLFYWRTYTHSPQIR